MSDVTLRTDPFPDDAAMADLMAAVWGHGLAGRTWKPVLARSLAHVGAYLDDHLVGFVNVAWDGGVHAFLLDTSVHPAVRQRGIGTRLVTRAIHVAGQRGAVWLHVDFEPHLAGFYTACGFRPTAAGLIALNADGVANGGS